VVDDNHDAADSLAMVLEMLGADCHVAYDGASALEAVPRFRPEVVLLDLAMPGMDGYEVAQRLREEMGSAAPRLVALTGWGQPDDRRRTRETGFDHHLVKPVELGALQSLLALLDTPSGV
jgi:CheY-like chemotaxis protein